MERRALDNLSIKGKKIIGRPVLFNAESENLGGFVEIIAPNAFSEHLSLNELDVKALYEHDRKLLLGRTTSGTLTIQEDNQGLLVEIDPPDTQTARDLLVSIERGDISGMSFGFITEVDEWDYSRDPALRTVIKAKLLEVTVTSDPAYKQTDVQVAQRSFNQHQTSLNLNQKFHLELMELI
jgi:HK97 family phage prohead protease